MTEKGEFTTQRIFRSDSEFITETYPGKSFAEKLHKCFMRMGLVDK